LKKFECQQCGHCCTGLLGVEDGREYGIYLTPEETKFFPSETVFPLFRSGGSIFAYQLGVSDCPNLMDGDDGRKVCKIYLNRPLVCRSFPAGISDDGRIIIQYDKCSFTAKHIHQKWAMTSFSPCFQAVVEQIRQANETPQATEMFVLNGKKWVTL